MRRRRKQSRPRGTPNYAERASSWSSLYPFASHWMSFPEGRMHYVDEGEGPVLLFSHGNPTWSFYWRELIQAFRGKYRTIAVDHLGCGLSDRVSPKKYRYRLEDRIRNLTELVERLDLRQVTLIAHDWGGAIGMGTATRIPERFARFVLMNTAAFRMNFCPKRIAVGRSLIGRIAIQRFNAFARAATQMTMVHQERMTPEVRSAYLEPYNTWHNREAIWRFVRDIPRSAKDPSYRTLSEVEQGLPQFAKYPICLVWGMHDWCFTPAFLERFEKFYPEAESHRLDAGHYVVEDAFEQIEPILESFFERNPVF